MKEGDRLDFFAAHAPAEVPSWFTIEQPPLPAALSSWEAVRLIPAFADLPEDRQKAVRSWAEDPCYDPDDDIAAVCDEVVRLINESRDRREKAERDAQAARYFAWRWHYANTMANTRFIYDKG